MKTFETKSYTDTEIVLKNSEDLAEVYKLIDSEENFILNCGGKSEVMIGNNLAPKIKNGDIKLSSEGGK